jgi:hypothetical protein
MNKFPKKETRMCEVCGNQFQTTARKNNRRTKCDWCKNLASLENVKSHCSIHQANLDYYGP